MSLAFGMPSDGRGTVQLAYRAAKDGENTNNGKDNALTAGLTYLITYNAQVALLETWYNGDGHKSNQFLDASGSGDHLTSVNLAVGF